MSRIAASRPWFTRVEPWWGSSSSQPPCATARVWLRADHGPGEASVSVTVRLPLAEAPAGSEPPPGVSRIETRDLGRLLDTATGLLGPIALDFPHSMRLFPLGQDPSVFELVLDPYRHGDPPVPIWARLRREQGTGAEWSVSNQAQQLAFGAVDLAAFVDVVNLVAALVIEGGRRIGAFGLARGDEPGVVLALLVCVDEPTLWQAERGTLHLIRSGPLEPARVIETNELPAFDVLQRPGFALAATTARGDVFHVSIADSEILMRHPPPPQLRFRGREFALMGGHRMQ